MVALKPHEKGGGLLVWPKTPDRAGRQWLEVPPHPELEKELREAYAGTLVDAQETAPNGEAVTPRLATSVRLPKLEFGTECRVRADFNWSGRLHTDLPRRPLTTSSCRAAWEFIDGSLKVADVPRHVPDRFLLPAGGFRLESELEEWLVANWNRTEFSETLEFRGRQYRTDVGPVDILCRNKDGSGFTVVELKRDRTADAVMGQTQRYMGAVLKDHQLVKDQQTAFGIIICQAADRKLKSAALVAPNIDVYVYSRRVDRDGEPLVEFSRVPKE